MKRWRRLLAVLLAALLTCALPLVALAEPVIAGDDGLALELAGDALEIGDALRPDAAELEIGLAEPVNVDAALDLQDNPGEGGEEDPEGEGGEAVDDGFDVEDGVVTGYHGEGGDIVIPERATAIGQWAFCESPLVTGVTIPGNIQDIGQGCFSNCPNLTRVTIEDGPTVIRHAAFSECPKLKEVSVPGSVKQIEGAAFNTCSALKKLTLGNGIEDIGWNVFQNCTSLTKVTIPDSVKSLGDACFMGCSGLVSLALPESLESVEYQAFRDCTGLKSVTIPGSVKKLQYTFKGCSALEMATIKEGLEYLYEDVFAECKKLKKVTLPNTLKHIGQGTFYGCAALKSIKIPESVEALESYAFGRCNGLTSVTIPAGVREFEGNPFIGCLNLKKIVVAKGNASFVFSGGLLYTRDMKTLICCVGSRTSATIVDGVKTIGDRAFEHCDNLKDVTIPGSVRTIGEGAFENCNRLKKVSIPEGVKTLEYCAFSDCGALERVEMPRSLRTIGDEAFLGCAALKIVIIPSGVKSIGENVFNYQDDEGDHPVKAIFIVEDGSYAQKYAKENGLTVRIDLSKAKVTVADQVVTGKSLKPAMKVVLNKKTLKSGKDYKVSYKANKAVGTATVTVTGMGGYAGTATGSFAINPKPVAGLKLEAGAKRLTASWNKVKGITGYQLQYSLKKGFAPAKKVTIAEADTVSKVIKFLQSGKTYYVRIRAYGKVNGKTYWSAWSDAQSVKVK